LQCTPVALNQVSWKRDGPSSKEQYRLEP
jgi:hypothetical protein